MQYERKVWIYIAVTLVIALGLVLFMGFTGQLFYSPHMAENHILLGEDIKIYLEKDASSISTLSFNGSSLPGDKVEQIINVNLPFESEDCYIRASLYISCSNGEKNAVKINLLPDWVESDGYYYFASSFTAGQTVTLTDAVILPEDMNLSCKKVYTIIISVETLRVSLPVHNIWENIPQSVLS